jgi:hypothetical protein
VSFPRLRVALDRLCTRALRSRHKFQLRILVPAFVLFNEILALLFLFALTSVSSFAFIIHTLLVFQQYKDYVTLPKKVLCL